MIASPQQGPLKVPHQFVDRETNPNDQSALGMFDMIIKITQLF